MTGQYPYGMTSEEWATEWAERVREEMPEATSIPGMMDGDGCPGCMLWDEDCPACRGGGSDDEPT